MLVTELVDDLAAVPEGIVLQVIDAVDARGPGRIEGAERPLHRKLAQVPVAVVGKGGSPGDPGAEGVLADPLQAGRGAIDGDGMKHLEVGTGTEEVGVFQLHPDGVGAARAAVVEAWVQCPDIARSDAQIDLLVVITDLADPDRKSTRP